MEPRWNHVWAEHPSSGMTFLGGTAKIDLWASAHGGDTRFSWGDGPTHWHWPSRGADGKLRIYSAVLDDAPTDEELDEMDNFLNVFVPWVLKDL